MFKRDAQEAVPLANLVLNTLLAVTPLRGRPGSDLRTAIGAFKANAAYLIQSDLSGPPLADIFTKARLAGILAANLDVVRGVAAAQTPQTLGAKLVQNALIQFTIATECYLYATTVFASRDEVEAAQLKMNAAFAPVEEIAADDMDYVVYRAYIELHAALNYHFAATARPLPRMLKFQFAYPASTLFFAYRLYTDASRGDQLRAENKVVHPAFALPTGIALSK
jgi:prophage DNA circulation protein